MLLQSSDYDLIKMLSVTCHATRSQIFNFVGEDRLNALVNEGVLKKTDAGWLDGKPKATYRLNTNAQAFVKTQLKIKSFYTSLSPTHDIYLSDKYLRLSVEERATVRTENQTRSDFQKIWKNDESKRRYMDDFHNKELSGPDFSYKRSNGKLVYVEISNGYKTPKINAKYACAAVNDADMDFLEIKHLAQ